MAKIDWGEKLELKIRMLPESPGCYLMKDKDGTIIYVGKAVNLKNRVRSYFRDTEHTPKVAAMISHIDDFDILLCDSNLEALCLECNLIKLHKPYYNILLKDDKHYPYLRVNLKEPFPRLTLARRMEKDGAKYFGPYIGATAVRQVIDAVRGVFPLRTCRKELPLKTPCRPCVNYEIGKCLAPCAGKCTEEQYWDMMDGVLAFLGGDYKQVLDVLNREMMDYAAKMQYERAAVIRDKIRDVQGLMERQIAIQTDRSEQDILAIAQDGLDAMIQLVYVRGGRMVGGDHFALPREGSEPAGDVLAEFLTQYYQEGNLIPRNILVQELPDLVLIDGGPQQLRFARQALLDMGADVAMFGLAKKQEEIFLPDREDPICLDHHTPELHLIQRVRDEAHRFCITHHRGLRGKASIHSQLEDIPGIGPKRRKALLTKLGSMKAIREATEEELLKVPGMNQAAAKAVRKWAEAQEKK